MLADGSNDNDWCEVEELPNKEIFLEIVKFFGKDIICQPHQ
jgi:hypothetical protein